MRRGSAISICGACLLASASRLILLEHFGHVKAGVTFFEPAVGLLVDTALDERLLDVVVRGIESRGYRSPSARSRQKRILVKILNSLFGDLHGGTEAGIEIAIEKKLLGGDAPDIGFAESGKFAARFKILFGRKALNQTLHRAVDISVRSRSPLGDVGFIANDPLVYETIENLGVAFSPAF